MVQRKAEIRQSRREIAECIREARKSIRDHWQDDNRTWWCQSNKDYILGVLRGVRMVMGSQPDESELWHQTMRIQGIIFASRKWRGW